MSWARGEKLIGEQCEWETTRERRYLSPISGERWPLAHFCIFRSLFSVYWWEDLGRWCGLEAKLRVVLSSRVRRGGAKLFVCIHPAK